MIDKHALIDPTAIIGPDVHIGPWSIIGPHVEIGEGTWIGPHAVIQGPTRIGKYNKIYQFASIGEATQDRKYSGGETSLDIGDHNVFRECCTVNRGTVGTTKIGNHNLFMAYTHVAHDCMVANHVIFSNNASIAGHVTVQDYAGLGGFVGVHQFCNIGAHSFSAGGSIIVKDVLPYVLVSGYPAKLHGLNKVGLKRRGFTPTQLSMIWKAYKIIFKNSLTIEEATVELKKLSINSSEVQLLLDFLSHSERGIVR